MAGEIIKNDGDGPDLAEVLGQQVGPGAYLCGQRLEQTFAVQMAEGESELVLIFEGAWDLRITGRFQVQLVES